MSAGLSTLDLPPASNGVGNASVHKMPSNSTMGWEDEEEDVTFDSPQEEIAHYREKYRQAIDMLTETRAELEEFQQSSKELEDEMEQELAANEKVQGELKEKIKRLEGEKEEWKSKQIALQKLHSSTTAAMQREMDNLRSERDKTLVALRDLEMGNDELERNERVAVSSLLDLESKYNRAIEEKTLLEQEIVQKQELEEGCQRLKDEMRDANNEISMLKDQLARMTLPTPPSSISEPISSSPTQEPPRELAGEEERANDIDPASIPLPPPVPYKSMHNSSIPQSPSRRLPRSATSSSIPISSPITKKFAPTSIPQSPTMSSLSRSTTSRDLAAAAKFTPTPVRTRTKSGLHQSQGLGGNSPGTVRVAAVQQTKSRGFKLLHDLQARLKATDDKLGVAKVPRRNVSNPLSNFGGGGAKSRSTSAASSAKEEKSQQQPQPKLTNPRITALSQSQSQSQAGGGTPMASSNSSSLMSPNGWVLVDGEEDDIQNTPTANSNGFRQREEPLSPIDQTFGIGIAPRAVSSASNSSQRSLPSRPGIPSPLTNVNGLNKSTTTTTTTTVDGRISRKPTTTVPFPTTNHPNRTVKYQNGISRIQASPGKSKPRPTVTATPMTPGDSRPLSPSTSTSRPMSPSMIPTSTSSSRPMSPSLMNSMTSASRPMSPSMLPRVQPLRAPSPSISAVASSTSSSRPSSRMGIGRGPPPSFHNRNPNPVSVSTSNSSSGQQGLRRSTRRSSVGAHELPTGIPAPSSRGDGSRTPVRPVTIHGDTPPPVPRIPSALRKK
ncbi:hypothetical protein I203_103388 [Kwoniella mangroviensis CBS 8507]|uniref:uncharacterized protein n=1 Tax=Kwoniella mangroviensis CBS 8507 TaxID=1296122 RepID=UPI00080D7015|nr:uncharacterized protein I203_06095 [Kwoniella mangroviensis CBS 8507]OCF64851.1 hypothetical protein I203_06095 [Kwoniella mangroviensis CBS 8507]